LFRRTDDFVESDSVIFTAGSLSNGIDLALHIVQLYSGVGLAEAIAKLIEYEGTG
jgi:transcriptional regulator GlxA family with amidase domain